MLLSLLALGVALVVIGMWRDILIDAWRTRPRSLPEGEGRAGACHSTWCAPVRGAGHSSAPSDSDNGYLATVDDQEPALYDWTFDDWRTTLEEIRGL